MLSARRFRTAMVCLALVACGLALIAARYDVLPRYGPFDKESHMSPEHLLFIRPGLVFTILGVDVPADGKPVVTFSIADPAGLPLDIDGVTTAGPVTARFALAYIPEGENQYVSYITRIQTSPITDDSAVQANRDSGGVFEEIGAGVYTYTFASSIELQETVTNTLVVWSRRDTTEFGGTLAVDHDSFSWVPAGGTPEPRNVISDDACARCHNPLSAHDEREGVQTCIVCHTPQSTDPDTGETVDFKVMIHKIHRGANLPSVEGGTPYQIIGFNQSLHDYSTVEFPQDIRNCDTCHAMGPDRAELGEMIWADPNPILSCDVPGFGQTTIHWDANGPVEVRVGAPNGNLMAIGGRRGSVKTGNWVRNGSEFYLLDRNSGQTIGMVTTYLTFRGCTDNAEFDLPPVTGGAQSTAYRLRPSRAACGACHDDVIFEQGINHPVAVNSDQFCSACHAPVALREFDLSVPGVHTVPENSVALPGLYVRILNVTNTAAGQSPTVTFEAFNKTGRRIALSELNRLRAVLLGPAEPDYQFRVQEDALGAVPVANSYAYTFEATLPMDAGGSTYGVGFEGRWVVDINEEITGFRDTMDNPIYFFPVTGQGGAGLANAEGAEPRRYVVADQKCDRCHKNLSMHGSNRRDTYFCVTCHFPGATDIEDRVPETLPEEGITFPFMIHRIHSGEELTRDFTVGTRNYNELRFPADRRECSLCHVDDSYNLPLTGRLPTVSGREFFSPLPATTAACVGCHDSIGASAHAFTMIAFFGEACEVCHGPGAAFSVEEVHAR